MNKPDSLNRLKSLFCELFQLDVADLDFGLYRLFRLKRSEIEAFLDKQLPSEAEKAFASVTGADRENLEKQVEELAKRARDTIADDAILPSGEPNPAHARTKAVKEYIEARKQLEAVEASEAQRAEVFNQLYAFFSRYYDEGDFIPRRFFGARSAYAVPYNGEEVFFHWANRDQYYVKSGEAFRDYAFIVATVSGEYRVRFSIAEATTPKDNTKGDTRYFFPKPEHTSFDDKTRTLTIPFEYRLPTEGEVTRYGKNSKGQEAILDEAAPKILKAVKEDILGAALSAPSPTGREAEGEKPPTLLRRRLAHFTRKNTTDYFVHKNLGAFLHQELEFFIRDQIVHEADLEGDFETKRRMLRVFRKLAGTVIIFLAQIEDSQKRLFEKKKFVLRTDYLMPIQNVPRDLWKEVLANKSQLEEWKTLYALEPRTDLFNLKGKINEQVLDQHPTLVVDTQHFTTDFIARLLEKIEDLDEWTDGVLMHGENFQALNLMYARYRDEIKSIYIDPPYNTFATKILYKNEFEHSSWLALIENRLLLAKRLLSNDGVTCVTIDDYELQRLLFILESIYGDDNYLATAVIRNNPSGRSTVRGFSINHEYSLFYSQSSKEATVGYIPHTEAQQGRYDEIDDEGNRFEWENFRKSSAGSSRFDRPKQFFPLYYNSKTKSLRIPELVWMEDSRSYKILEDPQEYDVVIYPKDNAGKEKVWRYGVERTKLALKRVIVRERDTGLEVYTPKYLQAQGTLPRTWWDKPAYSARDNGTRALVDLFGRSAETLFNFPKAPAAVEDSLRVCDQEENGVVLDYFGGSGTTGHAVINLNRENGGQRKFLLVEIADYFDTVLVPRIKKVMFTPDWKDGKPKRFATTEEAERTPRLVKVLRLESYEDALHNTFSDKAIERLSKREEAYRSTVGDDEYRIRYMVKLPLESSDSMLNLAKLEHPFDYTLEVLTDYGPKTETVDLVETFNWLYGLRVQRMLTWTNTKDKSGKDKGVRVYRAVIGSDREEKKRVLVVWRDMTGIDPVVDRGFLEAKAKEFGPFEEQWINGDTAAKGFASLDGLFKRLMAGDEV